jgi:hypothetical protein
VEEQLAGVKPMSQFGRVLADLGVELISPIRPQAKGRVERLFHTLQDRLIKAMRVAGIATLADANRFLPASLAQDNRRFAVPPAQAADLHRPLPAGTDVRAVCQGSPKSPQVWSSKIPHPVTLSLTLLRPGRVRL